MTLSGRTLSAVLDEGKRRGCCHMKLAAASILTEYKQTAPKV